LIEADMKFAADSLPEKQAEVGRVNSWAAKAYLAKIYMYQKISLKQKRFMIISFQKV